METFTPAKAVRGLIIKEAAQSRIPFLITGLGEGRLNWGTSALWAQQGNFHDSPNLTLTWACDWGRGCQMHVTGLGGQSFQVPRQVTGWAEPAGCM